MDKYRCIFKNEDNWKGQYGRWCLIVVGGNNEENQLRDEQLDKQPIGEEQKVSVMPSAPIILESSSK